MPRYTNIQEVFDLMQSNFLPDAAAGLTAVIQFDLTGEGGEPYYLTIVNNTGTVSKGTADNPNLVLTITANDYLALTNGELNPMNAFMQGKLKVKGDMALAMKFQSLFRPATA